MGEDRVDFEKDVLPLIQRMTSGHWHSDDVRADAVTFGWYYLTTGEPGRTADQYARQAVKAARNGRNLPGLAVHCTDVTRKLRKRGGGSMSGWRDRRPGPVREVISREEYDRWTASLTARDYHLIEWILGGLSGVEIAELLGMTPSAVSQYRRRLATREV